MSYIGNSPISGPARILEGSGTGDGTTTTFAMGFIPGSEQEVFVFIDGVKQDTTAYTINVNNCVFSTAPALGENIDFIGYEIGKSSVPQDASVTQDKLAPNAMAGQLINSYEVTGSAITELTFSSLDFTNENSYVLEVEYVNAGTNAFLEVFVNGDTTSTNYYTQYIFASTSTVSASRGNTSEICYAAAGQTSTATVNIQLANGYFTHQSKHSRGVSIASTISTGIFFGSKISTVSNIDSLTIKSSVATQIAAGSKFRLYRG